MSDSQPATANRAVFLSYASQDAEAVERIAVALRAAGVEVWFDKDELVGGDAWDQKIRGQIASCALFLPVISAATQARREGYFRIEWKLAAQRTHAMADGTPFLLPVVIDGTRDAEALVPTEFKVVQWTRQPGGETSPALVARVQKLLSGSEMEAGRPRSAEYSGGAESPRKSGPSRWWWVPAIFGVTMAMILVLKEGRKDQPPPSAQPPSSTAVALTTSAPLTEAQQLVVKARKILDEGDEMNRETYTLAEELLKKAEALDVTEASAWALACAVVGRHVIVRTRLLAGACGSGSTSG